MKVRNIILNVFIFSLFSVANATVIKNKPMNENKKNNIIEKKVESLTLNNVTVKEAARLISAATSTPIVVSNKAANIMVDVHLKDVNVELALKSICQSAGLWYQKNDKDGLLHIMTTDEFKSTLKFDRNEVVEVVQILYPNAEDIGDALAKLYVDRVIWLDPKKTSGDQYSHISNALRRMDLLGKRGTFDVNQDDQDSSSNINYVVDDSTSLKEKKVEVQKALKVDSSKINDKVLNSTYSLGKTNSNKALNIHKLLNTPGTVFVSVLPENNSLMLRSSDEDAMKEMLNLIEKLDKPNPQVLLEVKILSVLLDDSKERAVDFLFGSNDGTISGGFDNGSINTDGGQSILKPTKYNSNTGAGLIPQGSGINKSAAIFNAVNENFKVRAQILEKDERVTKLATPNLLVSNNESTTLFIGTETTVMEKAQSTVTYTEVSSGVFQPNFSWKIEAPRRKIGTSLLLTPKIHADRTVTLRLLQERSSLGQQVRNVYSGGAQSSGNEELYFISQNIDLQRIVTTVIANDKDFMVIGGLINEEIGVQKQRIPGLSDIPLIGELLFTRMASNRERRETLIIIRPFVMLAPGENQLVSKTYLKRMSQHPAARDDLPSLGVNTPSELAKPKVVNPNDPFLIKMFNKIEGWSVDSNEDFNVKEKFYRKDRRENHVKALKEIERINKNEK